jgi:hypothetical protein
VMPPGCFDGANFLLVDPPLQRGVADSENLCCVAGREEFGCWHRNTLGKSPAATGAKADRTTYDATFRRLNVSIE